MIKKKKKEREGTTTIAGEIANLSRRWYSETGPEDSAVVIGFRTEESNTCCIRQGFFSRDERSLRKTSNLPLLDGIFAGNSRKNRSSMVKQYDTLTFVINH